MLVVNSDKEACARLSQCGCGSTTKQLFVWRRQFAAMRWQCAIATLDAEVLQRREFLRAVDADPTAAMPRRWLSVAEVMRRCPQATSALIAANDHIGVPEALLYAVSKGLDEHAIVISKMLSSPNLLNHHAAIIAMRMHLLGHSAADALLHCFHTAAIRRVLSMQHGPREETLLRFRSTLTRRRLQLATASPEIFTGPWVVETDAAQVDDSTLEMLIQAKPFLNKAVIVVALARHDCDRSARIRIVAKSAEGSKQLSDDAFRHAFQWGCPGTRLIELFKNVHQGPTYQAMFECFPWLCDGTRDDLMRAAALRPNWQTLFRIMLPLGFGLTPRRGRGPLMVARKRRVRALPREAEADLETLAWLAKFASTEHVKAAIRAGHRIRNWAAVGTHPEPLQRLLRLARAPMKWSEHAHELLPEKTRKTIFTFMLCAHRLRTTCALQLPRIPVEMMCAIFTNLAT